MAETKADLIKKAQSLGIEHVNSNNTMAELREAIAEAAPKKHDKEALPTEEHEAKVAKAGKRSAKAIAEAEEKVAKEERKEHADETPATPMPAAKPARSRIERAGKKLQKATELVEKGKEYSTKDALDLAVKTATTKFDSTVELHVRLGVDPKHADQNIRENIVLPAGTGKDVKVAVFGEADDVAAAKKAGADIAGADEFLQQLDKGVIDFDVLIATPTVMAKLGKYARLLGPKGLMPNPKSGTVTKDVAKAIEQSKAGKVEVRVDETGIAHLGIGKVSFGADKLMENAQAVFSTLKSAKPTSIKGNYVVSIYVSTTMGPSIRIASSEL
ncbi:50S ribosomal protein L1 [Candidatus Saccharibacteria bacterium]|nr:50S ribosomal protein L1 [Candidatus Saccharibacteria bacterium]